MRIALGSDHAGFEVKEQILTFLKNHEIINLGCSNTQRVDYPDFANLVCSSILRNEADLGILVCGSGQGMAMRANKFQNIRAALCWNEESAKLSRNHNNANVLCLGARLLSIDEIKQIIDVFLKSEFEGGRHQGRTEKINSDTLV